MKSEDVVFFFGAGASAPFGIPTMRKFVTDFEEFLNENAEKIERDFYSDIKQTLKNKIHREVDLEAVFTVIDGISNYNDPEKLGMLALYFMTEQRKHFPTFENVETCKKLKLKFQDFVNKKCNIPNTFTEIAKVYRDFFNRFAIELGSYDLNGEFAYNSNWVIFTTNYDICLEYYWRQVANIGIDTNFMLDQRTGRSILRPKSILAEPNKMKLFKLHGSFNWLIDEKTHEVIEVTAKGNSLIGTSYAGELMVYPIAEKELYLEPYVSMLVRLNRELEKHPIWVVIGYSFNDPVIQEIFIKNWSPQKHSLILIHPEAREIGAKKLSDINITPIEKYFGLTDTQVEISGKRIDYRQVNHQIIHKLKENPKFGWNQDPVQVHVK